MERVFEKPIEKFKYDENYYVDIAITTDDSETVFEAWIYGKNNGFKMLMFGMPAKQQSYEMFKEIVEANVEDYIQLFEEFIDDYEEACWNKMQKGTGGKENVED